MSGLPRGKDQELRISQMKSMRRLHFKLKKYKLGYINTYQMLPVKLRDLPDYLFGITDLRKGHFIHYSGAVRAIYHDALGDFLRNWL